MFFLYETVCLPESFTKARPLSRDLALLKGIVNPGQGVVFNGNDVKTASGQLALEIALA